MSTPRVPVFRVKRREGMSTLKEEYDPEPELLTSGQLAMALMGKESILSARFVGNIEWPIPDAKSKREKP